MKDLVEEIVSQVERLTAVEIRGTISAIRGQLIECGGISSIASIGSPCRIIGRSGREVKAEIIGMQDGKAFLMPFQEIDGWGVGCTVIMESKESAIFPHRRWLGRVINAFAEPIDGRGPLIRGEEAYRLRNAPPPAHQRQRVGEKIDLGVRAINTFASCCRGQRLGVFAGSGIGKSVLLAMMTTYSNLPIKVIGLIGERGREVQEFIEEYLGAEGLAQAVIIVATSDESALMRKQAAYLTMAVAEYFRDQDEDVLCLMDSVTRLAMAQREIGLSAGEPPASKGYTPTVFAELPKILERAGPGVSGRGSITGLFTVLVEGDDHNEPISDAVRGIIDGHILLDRAIAERGRYPAVNVLRSVSRTMPQCNTAEENELVVRAKRLLSTYNDMAELIRLGAYRAGSNPEVDEAIFYNPLLEKFLQQAPKERSTLAEGYAELAQILATKPK